MSTASSALNPVITLTDMQKAYLLGGKVKTYSGDRATHVYAEYLCKKCNVENIVEIFKQQLFENDSFGISVIWNEGQPRQRYIGNPKPVVPMVDISEKSVSEKEKYIQERRDILFAIDFNSEELPRYAAEATQVAEDVVVLHIACDGMLMDGESFLELQRRLDRGVAGIETFQKPKRFLDYAESQTGREGSSHSADLKYWSDIVDDFDVELYFENLTEISTKMDAVKEPTFQLTRVIPENDWSFFSKTACNLGVTSFSLCLAVFGNAVSSYSKTDKFLINVPNRSSDAMNYWDTIGLLSSFLLIPYQGDSLSIIEQAQRISREIFRAKDHDGLSGPALLAEISKSRGSLLQAPIVFTSLVEEGNVGAVVNLDYLRVHTSQALLEMTMYKHADGGINVSISARHDNVAHYVAKGILNMVVSGVKGLGRKAFEEEGSPQISPSRNTSVSTKSLLCDFAGKIPPLSRLLFDSLKSNEEKDAVIDEGGALTYGELVSNCKVFLGVLQKAIRPSLSRVVDWPFDSIRLRQHVETNHVTVGLLLSKSRHQAIAEAACIIGSIAFMPINIDLPRKIIAACLMNAGVSVVIAERNTEDLAHSLGPVDFLVIEDMLLASQSEEWSTETLLAIDSYLPHLLCINTSGTTGNPKTISINDWALGLCLMETKKLYGLDYLPRTLALTNIGHDMALFDIVATLVYGGTVVIPSQKKAKEPLEWLNLIVEHDVNTWNSVPAFMQMYLELDEDKLKKASKTLQTFIFGGDFLEVGICKKLKALYPSARIFNCGGPSETTLWNIFHEVRKTDLNRNKIPYGKPFHGTSYRVLDCFGRECPTGISGNMHVLGMSLSNGYLSGNGLICDGFVSINGELAYPTGDIGYFDFDDELYILGRNDGQIKINGKRIELSGIENVLSCYKYVVTAAAVLCRKPSRLISFIVSRSVIDKNDFHAYLTSNLPAYMIPSLIVAVDELPKTDNGKVDRKYLRDFDFKSISSDRIVIGSISSDKQNEASVSNERNIDFQRESIASVLFPIVKDVLKSEISLKDNFYSFGGDSLQAMRISAQFARAMNINLKVYDLLANPIFESWVDLALVELRKKDSDYYLDGLKIEEAIKNTVAHYLNKREAETDEFFLLGGNEELAQVVAKDLSNILGLSVDKYDLLFTPRFNDWILFLREKYQ